MIDTLRAAEADWLAVSTASSRPLLDGKGRAFGDEFREMHGVAVCVKWEAGAGWIKRLERTATAQPGAATALLRNLQEISDRHGVPLLGNVAPLVTEECPAPDLDRLTAFYRRLGFSVGKPPVYMLSYPPAED